MALLLVSAAPTAVAQPLVAAGRDLPGDAASARAEPVAGAQRRLRGADGRAPSKDGPLDRRSYALGVEMGRQLRGSRVEVEAEAVVRGLRDALSGRDAVMDDEEIRAAIADLQAERKRNVAGARRANASENRKAGEALLAANRAREGVTTLPSGLQYRILKAGKGPAPSIGDSVVCHFRGTLANGLEFDSSYVRGRPATFPVRDVIAGWKEALQLMPVGSTWQLVIPPALAYGERGSGDLIGPDATLVFDVELLSIVEKR